MKRADGVITVLEPVRPGAAARLAAFWAALIVAIGWQALRWPEVGR